MRKKYLVLFKAQLQRPEYFFLYVAAFFGLLFAIIVPPLHTPDEYTHFVRSYEVSELKTPQNPTFQNGVLGSYLPSSIVKTGNEVIGNGLIGNRDVKYDIGHIKHALLNIPLNKDDTTFYKTSSSYNPIVYIPQALTLSILKLFDAPVIVGMYAIRVANLIVWLALIFVSIKLFPWKKWGVAILALLPMSVAQSVSSGVDVLLLGISILLLAIIVNLRVSRRKITTRDILLLIILATIVIICKTISIVILPLLFLLKNEQFSQVKLPPYITKVLMVTIPIVLYVLWMTLSNVGAMPATNLNMAGQNASEQVRFLLNNPLWFLIVNFNMIFFNYSDTIFQAVIGVFGAYDTPLPTMFAILGYILIIYAIFTNSEQEQKMKPLDFKIRVTLLLTAVVYILSASLAMYIFATAVGSPLISGIQGRYYSFAPFLFLVAFIGYGVTVNHVKYVRSLKYMSIVLLLVSLVTVLTRYYVETPSFPV